MTVAIYDSNKDNDANRDVGGNDDQDDNDNNHNIHVSDDSK